MKTNLPNLWNVRTAEGEWVGCTANAEDAAVLVAVAGTKATVEWAHLIVWREGEKYDGLAYASYDEAGERMRARRDRHFNLNL